MKQQKRKFICLAMLTAVCLSGTGCKNGKDTEPSQTAEVLASSQDADGYVYEACSETVYATGDVNIRSAATSQSEIMDVLHEGNSIVRIAYNYSWSKVDYEGKTGYVSSKYLTTDKPASQSTEPEAESKD